MSSKTVKITNGKILNYKISAPNYKTIYGSQLITADGTITKNMVPETSADGVYSLGDRIGNIASFVCYYTDEDNHKYAVFVVDAKYRSYGGLSNGDVWAQDTGLPNYDSSTYFKDLSGNPLSATYCSNYIATSYSTTEFPGFAWCNNIILASLNITAKVPNPYELKQIYDNRTILDNIDPTVSDYSSKALNTVLSSAWTCYENNMYYFWFFSNDGFGSGDPKYYDKNIVPVFEIPVN